MSLFTIIQSEEWMKAGERRCGCVHSPVAMHYADGTEVNECSWCGATWATMDSRVLSQWNDDGTEVGGNLTMTLTSGEWAVAK